MNENEIRIFINKSLKMYGNEVKFMSPLRRKMELNNFPRMCRILKILNWVYYELIMSFVLLLGSTKIEDGA